MSKAFFALALALAFGAAQAQLPSQEVRPAHPRVQPGYDTRNLPEAWDDRITQRDREFLRDAVTLNLFEVLAGQLAAVQAEYPLVRSYGSMLANHHTAANNDLQRLANRARVAVPTTAPRTLRQDVTRIAELEGTAFDRVFLHRVGIEAHEDAIRLYEDAAGEVRNRVLRAYIAQTLPRLREHLLEARRLYEGLAG